MQIVKPIDLDIDAEQARARQLELSRAVQLVAGRVDVTTVAATDVAYHKETDRAYAAIVVLDASTMRVIDRASWVGMPKYSYVPGLFSLREASCLLEAFEQLETVPDVVLVDGHGIAHPRRFGLASLLGISLELPTIGCAKNNLAGSWGELGRSRGDRVEILDDDEQIGWALRTQDDTNPVFVSPGHMYDHETAAQLVMRFAGEYRIPEPLRQAHGYSIELRAQDEGEETGEEVSS